MGLTVQVGDIICNGPPDPWGVRWSCEESPDGWSGSPGGTLEVVQRSGDHGGWDGDSYLPPRVMAINGLLTAPDHLTAVTALDRLAVAIPLSRSELVVDESGLVRSCTVRRTDDVLPVWRNEVTVEWSAQVVAPDPRRYGVQQVASTGLPSSSGGLAVPHTVPYTIDATVVSGVIAAENVGTIGSRGRLVIAGPCPGPRVALVGSGRQLAWDLTLDVGQWLDVDLDRKTSLLNGQVSRSGAMTERGWFELPPGSRSELAFGAVGYDPGALLTAVWRPAWQ